MLSDPPWQCPIHNDTLETLIWTKMWKITSFFEHLLNSDNYAWKFWSVHLILYKFDPEVNLFYNKQGVSDVLRGGERRKEGKLWKNSKVTFLNKLILFYAERLRKFRWVSAYGVQLNRTKRWYQTFSRNCLKCGLSWLTST